mmetsp:Transcript_279/g.633  ORF Transcript_279/g.633 Transcript_279/m.633 type:complete len:233 (-) Transcript_279:793-1491(-)
MTSVPLHPGTQPPLCPKQSPISSPSQQKMGMGFIVESGGLGWGDWSKTSMMPPGTLMLIAARRGHLLTPHRYSSLNGHSHFPLPSFSVFPTLAFAPPLMHSLTPSPSPLFVSRLMAMLSHSPPAPAVPSAPQPGPSPILGAPLPPPTEPGIPQIQSTRLCFLEKSTPHPPAPSTPFLVWQYRQTTHSWMSLQLRGPRHLSSGRKSPCPHLGKRTQRHPDRPQAIPSIPYSPS